ncbi:MAG: hypothetical protein HQL88_10220 [Magnetococcales bacterium]|nr:hypothetical protein [Magnetococcales bacterium]
MWRKPLQPCDEHTEQASTQESGLVAVGLSGVARLDPMVEILHLLVRAPGTVEPIWRLSQADPHRPGYTQAEIDALVAEKRIALFVEPMPVQAQEMALSVHQEFETFFCRHCGADFRQPMSGLRWHSLQDGHAVAVASPETLRYLRAWAADRLRPKVRAELLQVFRKVVDSRAKAPDATLGASFKAFYRFLKTALFSVDSVSGGDRYLEFLYWWGAAYLLRGYEAGVADLHKFLASSVTPACSRDDFYREVRLRKSNLLEDAESIVRMAAVEEAARTAQIAADGALFSLRKETIQRATLGEPSGAQPVALGVLP